MSQVGSQPAPAHQGPLHDQAGRPRVPGPYLGPAFGQRGHPATFDIK